VDKTADFGEDFAKTADFIVASNRALSDLLLALERTPPDQVAGAVPEISKQAQRARHVLQTMESGLTKLVDDVRARNGGSGSAAAQQVHVHVHLHLNTDNGSVSSRVER
jgi:hypothetical protein